MNRDCPSLDTPSAKNASTFRHRLQVARFDPHPCGFPKPRISVLPDLLQLTSPVASARRASIHRSPDHFRHFSRGRYALGAAYRLAGIGTSGALLAPAYHCITMLDPALDLDAEIVLYPLRADLSLDYQQLDSQLAVCRTPPRALLATHYFGRLQDFSRLRKWCDEHGLLLIEDCSHVLFSEHAQVNGAGRHGHFVISSPYKFFPSPDGGLLYSPDENRLASVTTRPATLTDELRGIKQSLEKQCPASTLMVHAIDSQIDALGNRPLIRGGEQISEYAKPSPLFSPSLALVSSLRSSRLIARTSNLSKAIDRRQSNFHRLAQALSTLPNATPLYREIAETDVPYMFPLRINHPEPHFYWLKRLGVPVWRWDEMALSDCAVAQDYRLHLIHLPCHQSLTEKQMEWMIIALQKTMRQPTQGSV